ncbi:AAA family ATPase [Halobacillus sp. HZG1]|uniref:AAA family ATPase n=1 Tax=Halobacillus sp. HZG1 TaxID=3111769 RepID=UPI002DBB842C|nr:AAA family ATPase [Halobacillus sp. HZG1]MEC3885164.1 AAA family ATPase [Halobacillus sp. HZG1]
MSSYIISKIYIKNFKTIDESEISFGNNQLNILDGPNGFGKTTIFDALELLITGRVRRIENNKIVHGSKGFNDILLSKYQDEETIIKVEFINVKERKKVVLARALTETTSLRNKDKRPEEFSKYKLFKLNNFNDYISEGILVENSEIDQYLNVDKLTDKYNMYHYVEQEDYSHIFKLSESERMNAISKLFNIEKESRQLEYVSGVKIKLNNHLRALNKELENEENHIDPKLASEELEEVSYQSILPPDLSLKAIWDQSNPPIGNEEKYQYIEELNHVLSLKNNLNEFKKELKNEQIDKVSNSNNKLSAIIIGTYFHKEIENLRRKFNIQQHLISIKNKIESKNIFGQEIDWDFVNENIDIAINKEEIRGLINEITALRTNSNNLSSIVNTLNEIRDNLKKQYQAYLDATTPTLDIGDIDCPFCGQEWTNKEVLYENFSEKTLQYKSLYDDTTKEIEKKMKVLYEEKLNPILNKLNFTLDKDSDNYIDKNFMDQLELYINKITDYNSVKEWFESLGVDLNLHINKSKQYVSDLNEKVNDIQAILRSKKNPVKDVIKENIKIYKHLYTEIFNQRDNLLEEISEENIKRKKKYLEYINYLKANKSFDKYQNLKKKKEKIVHLLDQVKEIHSSYTKQINAHRAKMIKDVEIPFYVYSGKIIQNHQRGMGVFIKEANDSTSGSAELKSINFIPPVSTEHDVLHSFSSGQLSATVLAFTLALNKVYSKRGFLTLLVDDPLQTMDDMNMVSFVETLRNDFNDKQIIISTHEDKISMFMRYKYLKYGLNVQSLNVKDLFHNSVK